MNTASIAIMVIVVMGIVGVFFGFVLAYANKKFMIEVNPLIHIVEDILPKGQCGSCGYAGCLVYAEAVVLDPGVSPSLCIPGKEEVAKKVAELTDKVAESIEPRVAKIKCNGTKCNAKLNYNYYGIEDCVAASLILGGPKGCQYGCVGLGTCVNVCPFGAMNMSDEGLPIVDLQKCTGCGKCEVSCPKKVIKMMPDKALVEVDCNSRDKGAVARKLCSAACIGCGICGKSCPHGAIKIENNLAIVDSQICIEKCNNPGCLLRCPTKAINTLIG